MIRILFGANAHGDLIGLPAREQWRIFFIRIMTMAVLAVATTIFGKLVVVPIWAPQVRPAGFVIQFTGGAPCQNSWIVWFAKDEKAALLPPHAVIEAEAFGG